MGWTSHHAEHYNSHGIDRKKECDAYFMEGINKGTMTIEKSAMVGSTYYAAVRTITKDDIPIPDDEQTVFGVVMLTAVDNNDYFNFSYKVIEETWGPSERDCPESILKLLSPTESEYAIEWREKCYKNAQEKKELSKLPYGTTIRVKINGFEQTFTKAKIGKTTKWVNWEQYTYLRPRHIIFYGYEVL